MKHLVTKILYRSVFSAGTFYNLGMIPASGTLRILTEDTDDGRLRTYELEATATRNVHRSGDSALEGDICLIVTYDNGLQARIGSVERPARLKLEIQDVLKISCHWQEAL